jgi:hypothetical protein
MTIKIQPTDGKGTPPGKLADAELHFNDGPLEGLKSCRTGPQTRRVYVQRAANSSEAVFARSRTRFHRPLVDSVVSVHSFSLSLPLKSRSCSSRHAIVAAASGDRWSRVAESGALSASSNSKANSSAVHAARRLSKYRRCSSGDAARFRSVRTSSSPGRWVVTLQTRFCLIVGHAPVRLFHMMSATWWHLACHVCCRGATCSSLAWHVTITE